MRMRLSALAWWGVACLALMAPRPVGGQMGLREVTSLRFEGNRQFSDRVLAASIVTRDTECRSFIFYPFCLAGAGFALDPYLFSEREFRRDNARVRLFYYLRGFREAVVDTVVTRTGEDKVEVTFRIQEGEPVLVTEMAVELLGEIPDSSVMENLPIEKGQPLSLVALDAARDSLEARLRNRGFAHVDVFRYYFVPQDNPYEAQVELTVDPGPLTRFGSLTVRIRGGQGEEPLVDESVVRHMLPFRPGDLYQEDLQFLAQRNLYNLELFRVVRVVPDSVPPTDSILPITVELEQGNVHNVRTGGGLTTAECFNLEARWSSRNFMGGARRLQATARVSNILTGSLKGGVLCSQAGYQDNEEFDKLTGSVSLDFIQPWFFSPRNSLTARVYLERQSIPPAFIQEAVGMNVGVTHALTPWALAGVSFRPRYSRLEAAQTIFCSAYLICDSQEIQILEEFNTLSPVGFSLSQDTRNQLLNPTRGFSAVLDIEHAEKWTGSDFRYTRVVSEATWHTGVFQEGVLATRFRAGWVGSRGLQGLEGDKITHPDKRLFAGGANSVRGFAQNRLGPRVLFLEDSSPLLGEGKCTEEEVTNGTCDAGPLAETNRNAFLPSPTGGTRVMEGSVEVRVPLASELWEGAAFLDFGQVWDTKTGFGLQDLEVTPGVGIRFFSPIGPVRVDLAYRFRGAEDLYVVTNEPGSDDLVRLETPVRWGPGPGFWNRVQIHLAIGQAF